MSKKKKNKFTSKLGLKILGSGKIKVKKNQKISLTPYITESINDTVINKLDSIISKEEVLADETGNVIDTNITLTPIDQCLQFSAKINKDKTDTLVYVTNKKAATDIFDKKEDTVIGNLMSKSTLSSIYNEVEDSWKSLNKEDESTRTNIMFIPKVLVLLDEDGYMLPEPYCINVLIVSVPGKNSMSNSIQKLETPEIVLRIVSDIIDASIKLGVKHLTVNPFDYKELMKDVYETSSTWFNVISQMRPMEHIKSIDFSVDDNDLYIIFYRNKKVQ